MTDTRFRSLDLDGLKEIISDEDIDLETLSYSSGEQAVSFDILKIKRDRPRTEKERRQSVTVCPIVRQGVLLRNVTQLDRRISKRAGVKLRGVTIQSRKEGTVEIDGCSGRLVMTTPGFEIEVGPETETEYECVRRKLWGIIGYWTWRLKGE
jgi:hypothetical protein